MDEEILFDFRRSMENLEEVFQPARTKHGQNTDRRMRVGFDLLNLLEVVHDVEPMVDDQFFEVQGTERRVLPEPGRQGSIWQCAYEHDNLFQKPSHLIS